MAEERNVKEKKEIIKEIQIKRVEWDVSLRAACILADANYTNVHYALKGNTVLASAKTLKSVLNAMKVLKNDSDQKKINFVNQSYVEYRIIKLYSTDPKEIDLMKRTLIKYVLKYYDALPFETIRLFVEEEILSKELFTQTLKDKSKGD